MSVYLNGLCVQFGSGAGAVRQWWLAQAVAGIQHEQTGTAPNAAHGFAGAGECWFPVAVAVEMIFPIVALEGVEEVVVANCVGGRVVPNSRGNRVAKQARALKYFCGYLRLSDGIVFGLHLINFGLVVGRCRVEKLAHEFSIAGVDHRWPVVLQVGISFGNSYAKLTSYGVELGHAADAGLISRNAHVSQCARGRTRAVAGSVALNLKEQLIPVVYYIVGVR